MSNFNLNNPHGVTLDELHAFVDHQLASERRNVVLEYLGENPDAAAVVADWSSQNAALAALYDPIASEPLPPRLDPYMLAGRELPSRIPWRSLAASILLLVAGGVSGWIGHGLQSPTGGSLSNTSQLLQSAFLAHELFTPETAHAVEVGVSSVNHLEDWISNRMSRSLPLPLSAGGGFDLIGGRLLPTGKGVAAQLMFEDADGRRITIYLTPQTDGFDTKLLHAARDETTALYWSSTTITCVIVGDIPREELETIANGNIKSWWKGIKNLV